MKADSPRELAWESSYACSLGHPLFGERYRAIDARDVRFDGQFFTAVSSTGIYCRPSCPARTPKPENVTFYSTSAAAHEAGFRACKRCLPEASPGTPEWNQRHDLAGRAMRLIADGTVDREGIIGLASRLGYSTRHVHRVLVSELGAGPLALARARRAQSARSLLVEGGLPLAEVCFAAGFTSVRQFNTTIQEVFAARPSELRSRFYRPPAADDCHPRDDATAHPAVRLRVELPVRQPFDALGVFGFLADRAIDGVEVADLSDPDHLIYARTLSLPGGPGAIQVKAGRDVQHKWRVTAHLELSSLPDVAPAVSRLRRLLDLDADPVAIDSKLSRNDALAPLVAHRPGVRVPGAVDPHKLVIRALVGQQISVAAARTHLGRLAAHAGATYASAFAGLTRLFPTPHQIVVTVPDPEPDKALEPERVLRLPRRAVRAILAISHALDSRALIVAVGDDTETLRARMLAWPGIGPWTASYVAMRALGDPDVWLDGDAALVAGAKTLQLLPDQDTRAQSQRTLTASSERWSPWRSYAVMHLWLVATGDSPAKASPNQL